MSLKARGSFKQMHAWVGCNTLQPTQIKMLQSTPKQRVERLIIIIIIIIIINQGTNARRCPMPFSLFDAIFVSPKQRGIVLVLMHHTSLLYCPSILYVVALFF